MTEQGSDSCPHNGIHDLVLAVTPKSPHRQGKLSEHQIQLEGPALTWQIPRQHEDGNHRENGAVRFDLKEMPGILYEWFHPQRSRTIRKVCVPYRLLVQDIGGSAGQQSC